MTGYGPLSGPLSLRPRTWSFVWVRRQIVPGYQNRGARKAQRRAFAASMNRMLRDARELLEEDKT